MRRALLLSILLPLGVLAAACGNAASTTTTQAPTGGSATTASACSYSSIQHELYHPGQLTIATDNPVYVPWFWANHPANGLGYEGATAYAVAKILGFNKSQVAWAYEPFNDSYAPGPKKFDFDINEISITPQRAQEVTFSVGYYDDTQALVALKNSPIVKNHSPEALRNYLYGDQIGTTSLAYINSEIMPHAGPKPFNNLNDVAEALAAHQIDAFVTDTPTAQYMAADQIPDATVIGHFPSNGEQFGVLFAKGNGLVTCVNKAIEELTKNNQLAHFSQKYLNIYNVIPEIKP